MFIEWRRMERTGLRRAQEAVLPLWERTRLFRAYSSWLIPGAVQTSAYTTAVLRAIAARRELPDDVEDAVAVRADRLRLLREGDHRFLVLIEESVLRNVIGGAEVMAGQLGHLITVASLPSVSVGIIPMGLDRDAVWPVEDFWIFDDRQVNVELVSGWLTLSAAARDRHVRRDIQPAVGDRGEGSSGAGAHHGRDQRPRLNCHANTCKFVYPYPVRGVGYLYPRPVREERHVTWDGRHHATLAGGQRQAVADEVPREQA